MCNWTENKLNKKKEKEKEPLVPVEWPGTKGSTFNPEIVVPAR